MSGLPVPEQDRLRRLTRLVIASAVLSGLGLAIALGGNIRVAVAALALSVMGQAMIAQSLIIILKGRPLQ